MISMRSAIRSSRTFRNGVAALTSTLLLGTTACAADTVENGTMVNEEVGVAQSNAEVVGQIYESFGRGELDGAIAVMAPDVIWSHPGSKDEIPFAGDFEGTDGVREFFSIAFAKLDVLSQDVLSMVSEGDRVVVFGREHMRVKATGKEYKSDWVHAYTLKDGQVVRFDEYIDTGAIIEGFSAD